MKVPVNINASQSLNVPTRTVTHNSAVRSSHSAFIEARTSAPVHYPRRQRIISVDMDGTIADLTRRIALAEQTGPNGTPQFYEVLLDGRHYHMDAPVEAARSFLWRYVRERKGKIVYLSGRRQGSEEQSEAWLREHQFPVGRIIHREMGYRSFLFKRDWLQELRRTFWIDAHFGDRLDDDGEAARRAGIRFVHINDHTWPSFDETHFR